MSKFICENCGSNELVEEDGIPACKSCGTKYPNLSVNDVGIDEGLKVDEIKRLKKANSLYGKGDSRLEPAFDGFTDEEILRYSPKSMAAQNIRTKNANNIIDKIKVNENYQLWAKRIGVLLFIILSFFITGALSMPGIVWIITTITALVIYKKWL